MDNEEIINRIISREDVDACLVLCEECKYRHKESDMAFTILCGLLERRMRKKDFCIYGEHERARQKRQLTVYD